MLYFKHLINKFCFKVKSSNLFKFFFGCVFLFFFIPNVYATNDFNGLDLSLGNKVVGYNWSSSTQYTSLSLYQAGENYEEYVYYATQSTVSTGTNGISFAVTMDNMMLANHYYRLVYVVTNGMEATCGAPASWNNQLRFSYTASNSMTNTVTYERSGTNIGNSLELGYTNPVKACTYFHIIKPSQNVIFMNLPVNTTSATNTMWHFYGYYIEDLGDADSLTATDLENSISDLQSALITNQTNNTNAILNQNHTYNNNASDTVPNQSDINTVLSQQNTLSNSLNLSTNAIDVQLNTNATTWIWGIVNNIRTINGKITLLFTTILSLAIIKMILNR